MLALPSREAVSEFTPARSYVNFTYLLTFSVSANGAELNVEPGATPKAFEAESAIHRFTNVSRAFSACTVAIKFLGRCPRLTVTGAIWR